MTERSFNPIFSGSGTTIFERMSVLARQTGAINLGQGFPEGEEPPELLEVASRAFSEGWQQYPPLIGLPSIRQAVARHEKDYYGIDIDPDRNVFVTCGATEALAAAIFGLVCPGDEVVLFEPLYDAYLPLVRQAGGVPKIVSLSPPDWEITREALEEAFSPKTKLILMNSPMNPTGKVFTAHELEMIADFTERFDSLILSDEVYEHLTFGDAKHLPVLAHPRLKDRSIRIGSAGKIFSVTGWKIGFVVGDAVLLAPVIKAHQFLVFTLPPGLQEAVGWGLDNLRDYIDTLAPRLEARRDMLTDSLRQKGYKVLPAHSTYFLSINLSGTPFEGRDEEFCIRLTEDHGVAAIPIGAFCPGGKVKSLVRFCFAKKERTIMDALEKIPRAEDL